MDPSSSAKDLSLGTKDPKLGQRPSLYGPKHELYEPKPSFNGPNQSVGDQSIVSMDHKLEPKCQSPGDKHQGPKLVFYGLVPSTSTSVLGPTSRSQVRIGPKH